MKNYILLSLFLSLFAMQLDAQNKTDFKGFVECLDSKIYCESKGSGLCIIMAHAGYLDSRMWDKQSIFLVEMGSRAAIEFAIEKPEMVKALILGSPGINGYNFNSDKLFRPKLGELLSAYSEQDTMKAVEIFTQSWTDGPYRKPEQVDSNTRELIQMMILDRYRNHGFRKNAMEIHPQAIKQFKKISKPCLIITAEQDMPSIIDIAGKLNNGIDGSKWEKFKEGGHMVNMESPEKYNQKILSFLKEPVD